MIDSVPERLTLFNILPWTAAGYCAGAAHSVCMNADWGEDREDRHWTRAGGHGWSQRQQQPAEAAPAADRREEHLGQSDAEEGDRSAERLHHHHRWGGHHVWAVRTFKRPLVWWSFSDQLLQGWTVKITMCYEGKSSQSISSLWRRIRAKFL